MPGYTSPVVLTVGEATSATFRRRGPGRAISSPLTCSGRKRHAPTEQLGRRLFKSMKKARQPFTTLMGGDFFHVSRSRNEPINFLILEVSTY